MLANTDRGGIEPENMQSIAEGSSAEKDQRQNSHDAMSREKSLSNVNRLDLERFE